MSPILCFTAEEVWGTRYPDGGSVHLLDWPEIDAGLARRCARARDGTLIRATRERVTESIEPLRRDKVIGSSLEAKVRYPDWNWTSPARTLPISPKSTSCPK